MHGGPKPGDEHPAPPGEPGSGPLPESGDQAKLQEEVAARATLEAAFEDQALAAAVPEESPFELNEGGFRSPVPAATPAGPTPKKAEPQHDTLVEAKTVRPPSSRVVPKGPPTETAPAGAPADVKPPAASSPAVAPPPPIVAGPSKKAPAAPAAGPAPPAAKGAPGAPVAAAPKGTSPAPAAGKAGRPAGIPVAALKDHDETAAWEAELAQLNLKDKERGLLRGTGAKATTVPVDQSEVDLMSLLDSGGMPGEADGGAQGPAAHPPSVPLVHAKEGLKPPETGAEAGRSKRSAEAPAETAVPGEAPAAETRPRPSGRPRSLVAAPKSGSSVMKYLLLFILLLGGGGAAWVFYIQPRLLGGAGQPGQPVAPPAGSPAGTVDGSHGPIPTPIGGTSRQQTAAPQPGGGAPEPAGPSAGTGPAVAVKGGSGDGAGRPPAEGAPGAGTGPQGGGGAPAGPATQTGGTAAAAGVARPPEPIKPAAVPQLSPEEARRKITAYTADGRRLMGIGKWREARAKLQAVLALDPANIEVKGLADQAQAKIDEDQKLQDEFDSVKKLYADKDYENALRKLYRLPRDKGLGDVDLYIRNAWFDWAVVLMKAGNAKDAQQKLSESLTVDPDDASALKLQEVAERYTNRAKDRVYYAFTDSLSLRGLDQK